MQPYSPGKPVQSSSNGTTIVLIILAIVGGILLLIVGCIVAIFFGLSAAFVPAVSAAREAAQVMQSKNNLIMIGIGLHNYHDTYGQLPRAYMRGEDGEPGLSWRVTILPFMEQGPLSESIDINKRWNELPNGRFNSQTLDAYHSPLDSAPPSETSYLGIVGPGAAFSVDAHQTFGKIRDGTSNTICVIEVQNFGINWMEPRDATIDEAVAAIKNSPTEKVNVLMLDGSVRSIDRKMPPEVLRGMLTIDGGERPPSDY